jgi:hypothetical protein
MNREKQKGDQLRVCREQGRSGRGAVGSRAGAAEEWSRSRGEQSRSIGKQRGKWEYCIGGI